VFYFLHLNCLQKHYLQFYRISSILSRTFVAILVYLKIGCGFDSMALVFKWMWRRRKQTQNRVALPSLSTRADKLKRVNPRNLRCSALRWLRCMRLNVRPALQSADGLQTPQSVLISDEH